MMLQNHMQISFWCYWYRIHLPCSHIKSVALQEWPTVLCSHFGVIAQISQKDNSYVFSLLFQYTSGHPCICVNDYLSRLLCWHIHRLFESNDIMDLISSDEEYDPQPEHRQHTQIFAHSGQHEPTGTKISTKVNNPSAIMFAFPTLFHQFLTIPKISQNL